MLDLISHVRATVGYGLKLPADSARGAVASLCGHPAFSDQTDPQMTWTILLHRLAQGFPRIPWHRTQRLDSKPVPLDADLNSAFEQTEWDLAKLRTCLALEPWDSAFMRGFMHFEDGMALRWSAHTAKTNYLGKSVWSFGLDGERKNQGGVFYPKVIQWFGGEGKVLLTPCGDELEVEILNHQWGQLKLEEFGRVKEGKGKATSYGNIDFYCDSSDEFWSRMEQISTLPGLKNIQINEVSWRFKPATQWSVGYETLKGFDLTVAGVMTGGNGLRVAPPDLEQEMQEYDLIPLGFFGGSGYRGKPALPPALRKTCLAVDLMRENDGWCLCFTAVDGDLSAPTRLRMMEALNSLFPEPIITRTPHDRWGLLPGERKPAARKK